MVFILFVALIATLILAGLLIRERQLHRRQHAIRALLDGADAFEAKLQACRERMQRLREMLSILPDEMVAPVDNALSDDAKVQAALRDLLAHRLWIQQHAEIATIAQFDAARVALEQTGTKLDALLQRLDTAAADLERAQTTARQAGRRTS